MKPKPSPWSLHPRQDRLEPIVIAPKPERPKTTWWLGLSDAEFAAKAKEAAQRMTGK
jgi:hypothetical protein